MKAQELIAFLGTFAAAKAKQPVDSAGGDQAKQRKQKELPKVYKELTLSEFEGLQEKEDAWLVAFSAGGTATRVWQSGSPHCHLRHKHGQLSGVACWSGSMSSAWSAIPVIACMALITVHTTASTPLAAAKGHYAAPAEGTLSIPQAACAPSTLPAALTRSWQSSQAVSMSQRAGSCLLADVCQGQLAGPQCPVTQRQRCPWASIRLIGQAHHACRWLCQGPARRSRTLPPCGFVQKVSLCKHLAAHAAEALPLCLQMSLLGPAALRRWTPPPCWRAPSCKLWADRAAKVVPALLAGASAGASCAAELEEWNSAALELGGLTGFAHVNLSATDFMQAEAAGVATAHLQAEPCRLQAVLLPFGDKDEVLPFKGGPHISTLHTPVELLCLPPHIKPSWPLQWCAAARSRRLASLTGSAMAYLLTTRPAGWRCRKALVVGSSAAIQRHLAMGYRVSQQGSKDPSNSHLLPSCLQGG